MSNPVSFDLTVDADAKAFLDEIVKEARTRFRVREDIAVNQVNAYWKGKTITGDHIIYHESPAYWAQVAFGGRRDFWRSRQMRLSEFCALPMYNAIPYLEITAWDKANEHDVQSVRFASCNNFEYVKALDLQRLGLGDDDGKIIPFSSFSRFEYISLAGNTKIGEGAVRAFCYIISKGYFDPLWIDLRGTDFDVTPYTEDPTVIDGESKCLLRFPKKVYDLADEFGWQRWMTLGYGPEADAELYIPETDYPSIYVARWASKRDNLLQWQNEKPPE